MVFLFISYLLWSVFCVHDVFMFLLALIMKKNNIGFSKNEMKYVSIGDQFVLCMIKENISFTTYQRFISLLKNEIMKKEHGQISEEYVSISMPEYFDIRPQEDCQAYNVEGPALIFAPISSD